MHAAASYGHLDILAYLVSQGQSRSSLAIQYLHFPSAGGDVNIADEDGDTPLYTVENLQTARWLLEHGAILDRRNNEGVSVRALADYVTFLLITNACQPIEHLREDFPEVASYLHSRLDPSSCLLGPEVITSSPPSQHQQNMATEALTSSLMHSVNDIMGRAEAEGRDPDEELRQVVGRTVLEGVIVGYEMTADNEATYHSESGSPNGAKRPRTDDGSH